MVITESASSEYLSTICELMENNTVPMCDSGYADLILPNVKKIAEIKQNDWVKMQEILSFFKTRVWMNMTSDSQLLYDEILSSITKQDIVSRFARIEKESYLENPLLKIEQRLDKQRNKYKNKQQL